MTLRMPSSEPKAPGSYDRSVSIERTLALVPELRKRFGITRIADTTRLDRPDIPTFSAVVPHSDLLSVFNGKGATREAALVSAVMEAVERQVMGAPSVETHRRCLREISRVLDLDALGLLPEARDLEAECAWGTDLLGGDNVPVPMHAIQCPWYGQRLFSGSSSNGVASGNTLTEALYHGLAELVERHVWSLFHVRCELVPRFYRRGAPDTVAAEMFAFPSGDDYLDRLARSIEEAGLTLRVMILQEDDLPVVALATTAEPGSDPPMAHQGMGCSLSPAHAVGRAITECVQSRVVDIAGARDDLLRPDDPPRVTGEHTRRPRLLPKGRWFLDLPAREVRLDQLRDRCSTDLAHDLQLVLDVLRADGLGPVIAIEISPDDVPVSVVRIVAPNLETTFSNGRIGRHGTALFSPFRIVKEKTICP
ncbi:MAG TPA: YcaO-like family protein [Candidatus Baltobacteraceae bacterium]|jgi:ribosomal protein S12 methylthiotransferase accessory factor